MSEGIVIAIIGFIQALILLMVGGFAVIGWYKFVQVDNLKDSLSQTAIETERRLSTIESELRNLNHFSSELERKAERWFVLAGTKAMHSPDDHLGIDKELERFGALYIKHHADMPNTPNESWDYWRSFFINVRENPDANTTEKLLAVGYIQLCEHKMSGDGLLYLRKKVFPE